MDAPTHDCIVCLPLQLLRTKQSFWAWEKFIKKLKFVLNLCSELCIHFKEPKFTKNAFSSFIFTDGLFHDYRSIFITIAQGGASAKCYCASNYFQIVFWGIFNLCLLENELFAGSLHISINEKCHSYESFLEWKRFFMRQTQRKKISYKIVAHAMNPQDTHPRTSSKNARNWYHLSPPY